MEKERRKKNKPRKRKEKKKKTCFKGSKSNHHSCIQGWDTTYHLALFPRCQEPFSPEDAPKVTPPWFSAATCQGRKQKIHAYNYNGLWWAWHKNSKPGNLHILQEWSFHSLTQVKYVIRKDFLMGKSKQSGMEIKWSEPIILPTWDAFRHLFVAGEPDKTKYWSINANHAILKQKMISCTFKDKYAYTHIYTHTRRYTHTLYTADYSKSLREKEMQWPYCITH